MIYLIAFFLSATFIYISEFLRRKSLQSDFFFSFVGLLLPCLLAAFRSPDVGIDVNLYVMPNFEESRGLISNGFLYFFENMPFRTEIGFAFLLYIGNLFGSLSLSFFLIQLFIVVPIYLTLRRYGDRVSLPLGMLIFYFLSYNFSLSCTRVSIAMSCILYAYSFFRKGEFYNCLFVVIFACLFHYSAILVAIIVFSVARMLKSRNRNKYLFVLGISLFFLFFFFSKIMDDVALIIRVVNPRYSHYLYEYIGTGSFADVPITDFFCKLLLIVLALVFINNKKKINFSFVNLYGAILLFALIGRFFVLFNAVFYESMRIAFYFDMFLVLLVAFIPKCYRSDSSLARFGLSVICSLPAFFYWAYFIMWKGAYGTSVYSFNF